MALVTVQGLEAAKAKLKQLNPKEQRAAERGAMRSAGNLLKKRMQDKAPVATGRLRAKGISVSVKVNNSGSQVDVGTNRIGNFHELGTSKMRARPFMRPALDESQDEIIETYGEAFKKQIERLTGGG